MSTTAHDTSRPDDRSEPDESWLRRNQGWVKLVSVGLILLALFLLIRQLPVEAGIDRLRGFIDGFGVWGYAIFAGVYVLAAVLLVPGAALTLAAGAIFGIWQGFLTVIVGATLGACAAFLIARYLARSKVQGYAESNRKFGAIDAAVGEGGWKVVGLLRLSPVVPYSIGNYLFGLTPVRLVPYALASFFGMMPGTLLYVYIGSLATEAATGGGDGGDNTGVLKWVLYGVGLLATIAVTVYLTHLARKKLREQTDVQDAEDKDEGHPPVGWATYALPIIAVIALCLVPFGGAAGGLIKGFFGPPAVDSEETYAAQEGSADFDHSAFTELLQKHVDAEGFVDYPALNEDRGKLDDYVQRLADAPFADLGRDEKLALLINAYNAFTLQLILDNGIPATINNISEPFKQENWTLAGEKVSLDAIEQERIRPNFKESRIHFALVCAAFSCPPLRREAYTGDKLDTQLQEQSDYSMNNPRWLQIDGDTLKLTKIMDWYGGDFDQINGSPLAFAAEHNETVKQRVESGDEPSVGFLDYDWSLNSKANRGKLDAFRNE